MDDMQKRQPNPYLTGLAGLAIGAGIGALSTKALSDKKMRGKIFQAALDFKKGVSNSIRKAGKEWEATSHRISIGRIGKRGRKKGGR
ncbi:hypothetical protein HYU94_04160 [Candidatus Daviesbacteria bacterium]|nr:hypothetical protein [Candidatus Daviesbacteria bacterium]